jgi:site-specific DNA recombinase
MEKEWMQLVFKFQEAARKLKYCGDIINFKSYSKSYKMKKRIENPDENRAIFLNVHEPIIDRATWEKGRS